MGVHSFFILQSLGLGSVSRQLNSESGQEQIWVKTNPAEKGKKNVNLISVHLVAWLLKCLCWLKGEGKRDYWGIKSEGKVRGLYKFTQAWSVHRASVCLGILFWVHHYYAVSEPKTAFKTPAFNLKIAVRKYSIEWITLWCFFYYCLYFLFTCVSLH